ncbi:MAG: histidinol-phosphate transaminase [Bacteroides sp.]|nr:histidinol-phosphate aminotransferase family protein [Bacteroides sp.]MDD2646034.1 histidinol-phosphate transaminase [Bacteroides sp.]MDD4055539.1 histidinol-phosphate transaminase [Bacteroides sp.]MDD4720396.1 histidinol-phosphate transaminase [Bacteroides sp.]NLI63976.1 histidinol-phosphate aminotransferase family protein [Bacteroidales bacterium]
MKDKKEKPIYLDRNEFNYEVSPLVAESLASFNPNDLCTYTRYFQDGIKSELSAYLGELYNVPESNIVLGYGGEHILKNAIHYFLSVAKNKKIMIPSYSWWYYKAIADEIHGENIKYPIHEANGEFSYDIDKLIEIANQEKPYVLLIATPNNPTGNILPLEDLKRVLAAIPADTIVILDEAYTIFRKNTVQYIAELIKEFPNLLVIRTFSKFFGLPGLRLGYGFYGNKLKNFEDFNTMYLGYNKLTEKLGIAALKSTDYYNDVAQKLDKDKELYLKELNRLNGFTVYKSHANFILVKYPIELKEKLQKALNKEHIIVKFMNEDNLNSHMRITLGQTNVNKQVVDIIKKTALDK